MKKLSIRLINSKIAFFLITTTIILSLNLTPLILQFHHAPLDRTFALIHNNTQDFFFYQSLMNEGANGAWLTSDPYTTETHQSSVIFSYFLWLGKVSKVLSLPYAITYHLVRILLSLFFLFTIYYLLFTISFPYPRLTFFFFLFASPLMHQINDYGKISSVPYMYWWTGMDAIRRVAYLPHHMIGSLLLVLTLIFFIKHIQQKSKIIPIKSGQNYKYLLWAILLSPLLAFIHTPSLLILLLILPSTLISYLVITLTFNRSTKSQAPNTKQISSTKYQIPNVLNFRNWNLFGVWNLEFGIYKTIGLFVYWIIGLFLLLIMVFQTQHGFPWSQYIEWERKLQFPLDRELIGALGILFPFALLGTIKAFLSKRFEYILSACWFVVPFLFIPFASKLGISNIRLIQGVPYLPLAILAILGLDIFAKQYEIFADRIWNHVPRLWLMNGLIITVNNLWTTLSRNTGTLRARKFHMRAKIFWLVVFLLFSIYTSPTLSWSLKDQIREYWPIFGNVYFDNRLYNAFSFINQNFPAKTITLSTFYTGNYLPSFTHTVSFIGHFGYTYNIEEKQGQVRKFFENKMTEKETKEFLLNNKITLVFQGPEEKPIYKDYLYPKILKPVYDREEVTLYTLK